MRLTKKQYIQELRKRLERDRELYTEEESPYYASLYQSTLFLLLLEIGLYDLATVPEG